MATPTRDELVAQADALYPDFMAAATKAQIQALIDVMSGKEISVPPLRYFAIADYIGLNTIIDLSDGKVESRPHRTIYDNGAVIEGSGTTMVIDLSNIDLYNDDVIEYDPPLDAQPLCITFQSTEPAAEWQIPQEEPAPEEVAAP